MIGENMKKNEKEKLFTKAETTLNQILFEVLAINYQVGIDFEIFSELTQTEIKEDSSFAIANEVIKKIAIYQSEYPSLFINLENNEDPPITNCIRVLWGSDEVSFYEELEEKISKLGLGEYDVVLGFRYFDEGDEDNFYNKKIISFQNAHKLNCGGFGLFELLVYYRQACLLEKRIKESNKFKLNENFRVEAYVHDSSEKIEQSFLKYVRGTMDKPIYELFNEIGFYDPA